MRVSYEDINIHFASFSCRRVSSVHVNVIARLKLAIKTPGAAPFACPFYRTIRRFLLFRGEVCGISGFTRFVLWQQRTNMPKLFNKTWQSWLGKRAQAAQPRNFSPVTSLTFRKYLTQENNRNNSSAHSVVAKRDLLTQYETCWNARPTENSFSLWSPLVRLEK